MAMAALVAGAFARAGANATDPRVARCLGSRGEVVAAFEVARASQVMGEVFPNAGRAPELDVDTPAFVVVFDGPVDLGDLRRLAPVAPGQPGPPRFGDSVVCVLVDGQPSVYSDVGLRDWRRPG